jgi:hypothetical protein
LIFVDVSVRQKNAELNQIVLLINSPNKIAALLRRELWCPMTPRAA